MEFVVVGAIALVVAIGLIIWWASRQVAKENAREAAQNDRITRSLKDPGPYQQRADQ